MSAFKSIAQRDYAYAIEVFATRGVVGSVLDRKLFPSEAVTEALFYARLLAKRFGCEMVDRTAVVAPPAIVVKVGNRTCEPVSLSLS